MNSSRSYATDLSDVTLAVLAGGQGSRMGMPKSLLRVCDEPILKWLLERYQWPGPTLLVTAPETPASDGSDAFDQHAIDALGGKGPLQGVKTALGNAATEIIIIVTVDMPRLDTTKLAWLVERLRQRPELRGVVCRRDRSDDAIEPFPCALRRAAMKNVDQLLLTGRRAVRSLCDDVTITAEAAPLDWPADAWLNLNYPNQLAAFLAEHEQHREACR